MSRESRSEKHSLEEETILVEEKPKTSNPIIFARSETTHIPLQLAQQSIQRSLSNPIYNLDSSGSLMPVSLETIHEEEEEESKVVAENPKQTMSLWTKICYFFCCLCEEIAIASGQDMTTPLLAATSCQPEDGETVEYVENLPPAPFLKDQLPQHQGKKTLVLDLDETLVHSTFQEVTDYQYIVPVEIEGEVYNVYVFLRPGALEFIERMSKLYEVIVYTASLGIYADPLLDQMDPNHRITARLFRNHCRVNEGVFVKDLGLLGRDLSSVIMVDNASQSFLFQPLNGIECTAFIDDMNDHELSEIADFLEVVASKDDVRPYAKMWKESREGETVQKC